MSLALTETYKNPRVLSHYQQSHAVINIICCLSSSLLLINCMINR